MDGLVDVVYLLSVFAAAGALFFTFSSARAGKRALALIRRDASQREPGLTLEVIGATMSLDRSGDRRLYDVEIRLTNPADSWNLIAAAVLEVAYRRGSEACAPLTLPVDPKAGSLSLPLVIAAHEITTGHLFFSVREKLLRDASIDRCAIIAVDIDDRRREGTLTTIDAG
jgi:hypothetical protein